MNAQELQLLCERVLDKVNLPDPFDVNALIDTIEQERGRPIEVLPLPAGVSTNGPCGLWVATRDTDYLFYKRNTNRRHKVTILLHEIGHMLLGHGATKADQGEIMKLLLPTLDLSMVRSVLGRTDYDAEAEAAAETFATMVGARARKSSRAAAPSAGPVDPSVANLRERLGAALERRI